MLFRSLGCADSNDVSFVIFQDGVCQPFWSKWKTVFSLLLLQNLSNSYQNWLRWSLDRAAQKWLNRIFWLLVKKKVMMLWTTRSTQNWFTGCISAKLWSIEMKLGTLHQHHDLRITCQSWEQRHLWVVRYQKCTFSDITFENVVQMFLLLCPFILGLENQLYSATTSSKIQHWNGNNSWTPDSRKMKLSTPDYSLHADHIQ